MRTIITGASGMLGKDIVRVFNNTPKYEVLAIFRNRDSNKNFKNTRILNADITNRKVFSSILREFQPNLIIHCAAIVDVDSCETQRSNAYAIHTGIVSTIADESPGAKIVYVSSDSVFDGYAGNYKETDHPYPLNNYAETKLAGERKSLDLLPRSLVVRTNIYGFHISGGLSLAEWAINNLKNGVPINGFTNVYFNPVYTLQLAEVIELLVEEDCSGIFHVGSSKAVSKYEFLTEVAKCFGFSDLLITPTSLDTSNFKAKRPLNTVLNLDFLQSKLNFTPNLQEGLRRFYLDYNEYFLIANETN